MTTTQTTASLFDKAARKPIKAPKPFKAPRPKGWKIATEVTILPAGSNKREVTVTAGDEVTIIDFKGRARFVEYVTSPKGSWVTVIHQSQFRSIEADYIYKVHKMTAAHKEQRAIAARAAAKAAEVEARQAEAAAIRDAARQAARAEAARTAIAEAGQMAMFA